jgi:hypothetical protein
VVTGVELETVGPFVLVDAVLEEPEAVVVVSEGDDATVVVVVAFVD